MNGSRSCLRGSIFRPKKVFQGLSVFVERKNPFILFPDQVVEPGYGKVSVREERCHLWFQHVLHLHICDAQSSLAFDEPKEILKCTKLCRLFAILTHQLQDLQVLEPTDTVRGFFTNEIRKLDEGRVCRWILEKQGLFLPPHFMACFWPRSDFKPALPFPVAWRHLVMGY